MVFSVTAWNWASQKSHPPDPSLSIVTGFRDNHFWSYGWKYPCGSGVRKRCTGENHPNWRSLLHTSPCWALASASCLFICPRRFWPWAHPFCFRSPGKGSNCCSCVSAQPWSLLLFGEGHSHLLTQAGGNWENRVWKTQGTVNFLAAWVLGAASCLSGFALQILAWALE